MGLHGGECRPYPFADGVCGRDRGDGPAHDGRVRSHVAGLVLFTAEASHVVLNPIFQIKLGLIALGLANIVAFEVWVTPKVQNLAPLTPLPDAARPIAIASLAIWFCVAACGRLIAYF